MNVGGEKNNVKQTKTLFHSRQSSSPSIRRSSDHSRRSICSRCCWSLNDCMGLQPSTLSHVPSGHTISTLQQQLADLQREVKRQKELKSTYKARLDQAQDYLRTCLQVAKDNGLLDLMDSSSLHHTLLPLTPEANIRPVPMPSTPLPTLSDIKDQAMIHGWYIEPHEIDIHEQVGEGSTASIHRATWRGVDVAVKCIFPQYFLENASSVTWFAQELETLSRQRHPFVLRLMGACLDPPDHGWVVTELLAGGTLKEWLHGQGPRRRERLAPLPPLGERIEKGLEIAQAMQYLHCQKPMILHRDLKPSNVFLDGGMHVKVADFGFACFLLEGEKALTGETGTHVYMAPEVVRCEPYNEKCDVYSFAVILNELITGQHPYIDFNYGPAKIALEVGQGTLRPTLPKDNGELGLEDLINLIRLSWDEDPLLRPTFAIITETLRRIHRGTIE